jgi:hypothetical protein
MVNKITSMEEIIMLGAQVDLEVLVNSYNEIMDMDVSPKEKIILGNAYMCMVAHFCHEVLKTFPEKIREASIECFCGVVKDGELRD